MNVCIVLDSIFPTAKAYGITTQQTLKALIEGGNATHIFSHKPPGVQEIDVNDLSHLKFYIESNLGRVLRRFALQSYNPPSVIAWKISNLLILKRNKQRIIELNPDIVWTRDRPLPRFIRARIPGAINVIEMHVAPSKRIQKAIKRIPSTQVVLCPISKELEDLAHWTFSENTIVFSPMGIVVGGKTKKEFEKGISEHYKEKSETLRLGYFGKLSPNGKSKGFEEILDFLAQLMEEGINFKMKFVGVLSKELAILESAIHERKLTKARLEVISHIPHPEALLLMESCDFLLLPTNQDPDYKGFPIKAIEYAYSGRAILASDSRVNRDVFNGSFQPYWYVGGNPRSIILAMKKALNDKNLVHRVVEGNSFARNFDWKLRTSNILNAAKGLL